MTKFLKKYNEKTGKWEIISPTSTDDIFVSNTNFNKNSNSVSNLTNVLNDIGEKIDKLKQNVSWLAEHGGGNGTGGNVGSNYNIVIVNAGVQNNTLYVDNSKFSVTFKVNGGSINDIIEYRVIYDGNYINKNFTKIKVNTNTTIEINDIEVFSKVTPHTMVIEAIDSDGMTIPSYTLSIVESSIKVECEKNNILTIGESGLFDIFITNKIINSTTNIKIINTSMDNFEYNKTYISNNVSQERIPIDFYELVSPSANVAVGDVYTLKIEVQATTIEGIPINATPLYTTIMIQGSNKIVINLSSLTTKEEFEADKENGSEFAIGGNLIFGFTPYLTDNRIIYYAIQLESAITDVKKDIVGYYDLIDSEGNPKRYSDNQSMLTGELKTISWNIPPSETYIGEWLVKIKCWSSTGMIVEEKIGKCKIVNQNNEIFPIQNPIRGFNITQGNTQYASWSVHTSMPTVSKQNIWRSEINYYLPPSFTDESNIISVKTDMCIYNTNGKENGFLNTPSPRLRLSNESYATIDTNIGKDWVDNDGFTISLTFKSDFHPYNDRTIFFLGNLNEDNEFYNGMKIDLEYVYWYFSSEKNDGTPISHKIKVPIKQNSINTIDFVYMHKKYSNGIQDGLAKIVINGKIYKAVEAEIYTSPIPNKIYLGCACSSNGQTFNYADVDIISLNIFSKYLNDKEIVINSHNSRAERDDKNNIIIEKYNEWKRKNYFDETTNIPETSIYNLVDNDYKYICPGYVNLKGSNPPLPILWLNGQQSEFKRENYESTNNNADITKIKYNNFKMSYYDPKANNGKGKEVYCDEISISIQGTSTTTLRSKNLEIYFTKQLTNYADGRTQLFQAKDDWFPESQFTLKADVVDSAHANNATLGKWINTEGKKILDDTPPMLAVKNNPPKDAIKNSNGETEIFNNVHNTPTIKHTLEGFPIILMINFAGETSPEMLGIYSFNLGRYSYYNMGLSFFKSFSRRTKNEQEEWVDNPTPALIDNYEFYERTEEYENIKLDEVFSYEFGSDADDNTSEHNTWSQDDLSILKHIGSFKFNGVSGDDSQPTDKIWNTLKRLFFATARMPLASEQYIFDGTSYVKTGASYTADLNTAQELLMKRLSIKNAISYYVIANAFGMVDSLGKNLTLRSWNARYDNNEDDNKELNKWYPCFYDMDTALGLTNAGDENVASTVYMDRYENKEINEENPTPNNIVITRNQQQDNSFGAYNSKLWNIFRSTSSNGDRSDFVSTGKYSGELYEGTWRLLRAQNGPLRNENTFVELFTEQMKDCGELLYNLDYTEKYLTKYYKQIDDETSILTYGNIEMLHGDRVEYIRSWLKDRFNFLDGVFEVANTIDNSLPYYTKGYITCGGPVGGGYPILTFNCTSPTILKVEVGQNGQIFKYFLPSYNDTKIIMPSLSSDSKRISINSTTILTKIDGLKDIRFQKFESMSLPSFSQIDLSNITTLTSDKPIDFETVFISKENDIIKSEIRSINLQNANGTESCPVTITNYNKLKNIDIRNSCVTSISLPSAPLSNLLFSNSQITTLKIEKQPFLNNLDFSNCKKLQTLSINECENITELNISDLNLLTSVTITGCNKISKLKCNNNRQLTRLEIEGLSNLKEIDLTDCTNENLTIIIKNCNLLNTLIFKNIKTKIPIILPDNLNNVTTLSLEGCTNITGFRYGDTNSSINQYNNENVLDLRTFTSLTGDGLNMKNCSSVKYVKFKNDENDPFILNSNFFNGCNSLINVFGNISLNGTSIFSECTKFFIHELPEDERTPMPKENEFYNTTETNDGNITNISIKTNNLSSCFYKTNCNLYDVYYILQKCDNVKNLSSAFSSCSNVKNNIKNSLNPDIFKHCGQVTNMSSLFYNTNLTGILKTGLLKYCHELANFNTIFYPNTFYIDDKFFSKNSNGGNLKISSIYYFNPQIIRDTVENYDSLLNCDSDSIKNYYEFADSSNLLTNLPNLTTIYSSFNNSRYYFNDNNSIPYNEKNYFYTDLFYYNTKLTSINSSFKNIKGKGSLRNLFGGYEATINNNTHFPQSLSAITDSFIITEKDDTGENTKMYIGNSFLQKIKKTITYITGSQPGSNSSESVSSFNGSCLTKYIDTEGEDIVSFPFKIFKGCVKLTEVPAFFRNLERTSGNTYDETITLPNYINEYSNEVSMFEDTINLQNISYLFSNMKNIKYKLNGKGFKKCHLINVESVFAEPSSNNNLGGNKEGYIPYGLFLQEKTTTYNTSKGLTEEDAKNLDIEDETYGIENCVFNEDGTVKVEVDENGNIISGKTYPDNVFIKFKIDDKGIILNGENGVALEELDDNDIICPCPSVKTIHNSSYLTHNPTIKNMKNFMEYSSSKNLSYYEYNISSDEITYDQNTKKYNCKDVVVDNDQYNPIKFYINENFNPIYKIWDNDIKEHVINPSYDPRRVLKNPNWNPYKKKWNKWISDGSTTLETTIKNSQLYRLVQEDINKDLPKELPEELCGNYISQEIPLPNDLPSGSSSNRGRFETRNYFCPPDIFKYCENNENTVIDNAFYGCGGPDRNRDGYNEDSYIEYGLYGTIPPFIFEPITNIKSLNGLFYHVKGILPYKWATQNVSGNENGIMFPPILFNNMKKLNSISSMFSYINIYNKTIIPGTIFSTNISLENISRLFYHTIWGTDENVPQIDDTIFSSNIKLNDISYMFCTSDNYGNNRLPKVISSNLFDITKNPNIKKCSYFMYNGYHTKGSVPELWKWSNMLEFNKCYYGINRYFISNYDDIDDKYLN